MIQIYSPGNTNYEMNGDCVLLPELCEAEAELGGSWILNMIHPIDEENRWKNIVKESVISAPTFMGKNQLFRVDEAEKQDYEMVVKAYPIFFDSADEVFLMDKRPTNKNGQEALNILTEGTKYSAESDIADLSTAYFVRRNLMDAIAGDSPSFLEKWGGEPLYDNYKVIINKRAGGDHGAEVRYGKNMESVSFKEDMSKVVTRIVPVAFNGRTLSTNYVDSPIIGNYAKVYTKEIVFDDVKSHEDLMEEEDTTGLIVCYSQEELDAALTAKCNEQFEAGIDLPAVTIKVDMISLENTEEYKDFKDLVRIGMGDTVRCYNHRLDITTQARAIKITWDCITDSVGEVTLGDYEPNFISEWNSTIEKIEKSLNRDGTLMAERVSGIINGIITQIKVQSSAAQKVEARVILFEDLDPDSSLYGALAIGTQGVQIANKRTEDDLAWDWTTAITANGILADAIFTGLLSDKTGTNYWNLDTGEFNISNGTLNVSGQVVFKAEDYTEDDVTIAQEIIIGTREMTDEYMQKYDFEGKGFLNSKDLLKIQKLVNGDVEEYTLDLNVEINGLTQSSVIKTGAVLIGMNGLYSQNIGCNTMKVFNIRTVNADGIECVGDTGFFTTADGKTVNVANGIITGIV